MSYPTKLFKILTPVALAVALASCGGGGASFGGGGGGGGGGGDGGGEKEVVVSSIVLSASSHELFSAGTEAITLSAVAKDDNNNAIPDQEISFSIDDNDVTITNNDIQGIIKTATLTSDTKENRRLEVTAKVGDIQKTILVDVVGTYLKVEGPSSIVIEKPTEYIFKLKDSADKEIPTFANIEITSTLGTVTPSSGQTNGKGEFTVTLNTEGADGNKTAVILAKAKGAEISKEVKISGDAFTLTGTDLNGDGSINKELNLGISELITVKLLTNGNNAVDQPISVRTTRGVLNTSSVGLINGEATFTVASSTAGSASITAETATGLSTTLEREFIATTPAYLNSQATPSFIAPEGSSTIITKVRDANNNPVKNIEVVFNLIKDTVNGRLSDGGKATTDSLGRAEIVYTAGNDSSEFKGVEIRTSLQNFNANNPNNAIADNNVVLTVGDKALRIVLGHDHLVASDDIFYSKKFGVIVTDSAGKPLKDKTINFTIIPTHYYKGALAYDPIAKIWGRGVTARCPTEDSNNNGRLDINEDNNLNGKLEPTHDATVTGSGVTDDSGKIIVQVIYPKNTAWWSDQRIIASTEVNGTEHEESTVFTLPVLADDIEGEGTPPNVYSPYGTWGACTDDPNGMPPVVVIDTYPEISIIDSETGTPVGQLENSGNTPKWYAVTIDGERAENPADYTINLSGKVTLEDGPNDDFKLIDNDTEKDDSGFYISVTSIITADRPNPSTKPIFYKDYAVGGEGPILTLNGASIIVLNIGDAYNDLGANAVDQTDDVLDVETYGIGGVNTAKEGTYTVIYRATDVNGTSASIIRTIIVQ